ncbi:GDSL esterase/lipase 5 [Elaeis guineensis]|uniref:GDSL esterase/lipase 5 n=1 Tax=Elaeis guineensis var. tenera TaxID=51953 RepID=UPI003C6D5604
MARPFSSSSPISIFFAILLLSINTISSSRGSPDEAATAFFIFGDSIVDPGNNNYIETTPEKKANYHPYGHNGFFDKPTGRFTDGRVIVDFIAEYAKLPIIPPFLQPSASFINGANFGSAGAGILPETNQGLVIDLQTQLKQFDEVRSNLTEELGVEKARELISQAVYFISIGSNDYMIGYILNPTMREAYLPEEFVSMVIGNLSQSIQALYDKGARKFCFLSLCPLGCLPALRAANPKADGGCFEDISALASAHNNALAAVLTSLAHIFKGFKYANTDFYSWLKERIHNPSKYGFKDGVNACCGAGPYRGVFSCGKTKEGSDYQVCDSPEDYVWWDSFHASERIHEQVAKLLWSDPPSSVGPYNLEKLFFGEEKLRIADVVDEGDGLGDFGTLA